MATLKIVSLFLLCFLRIHQVLCMSVSSFHHWIPSVGWILPSDHEGRIQLHSPFILSPLSFSLAILHLDCSIVHILVSLHTILSFLCPVGPFLITPIMSLYYSDSSVPPLDLSTFLQMSQPCIRGPWNKSLNFICQSYHPHFPSYNQYTKLALSKNAAASHIRVLSTWNTSRPNRDTL